MIIAIDQASPVPIFEQLRASVRRLVVTGALPVGTRLVTVRQLAADLGIAPGTVLRALRELESEGIVESRGRHGTFVCGVPTAIQRTGRERRLHEAAAAYASVAAELAVEPDAALEVVTHHLPPVAPGRAPRPSSN